MNIIQATGTSQTPLTVEALMKMIENSMTIVTSGDVRDGRPLYASVIEANLLLANLREYKEDGV